MDPVFLDFFILKYKMLKLKKISQGRISAIVVGGVF